MAFARCRMCKGRGCIWCDQEADRQYKEAFPDGPKPILTVRMDNPEEIAVLKEVFSASEIERQFGPGGEGMDGIMKKLAESKKTHGVP